MILDIRGLVHLKSKNYDAAIADYNVVLKNDPDDSIALFGRGVARLRSGDKIGGETEVAGALKVDPEVADIMAKRGIKP